MSSNQRERLQDETDEEREVRLQQMSSNQRERLQDETDEEREVRLQQMRERLQNETDEERQARLEQMRAYQRARIRNETKEERQVRLEQRRGESDIAGADPSGRDADICHHANHTSIISKEVSLIHCTSFIILLILQHACAARRLAPLYDKS